MLTIPRAKILTKESLKYVCDNIDKYAIFTEISGGKRMLLVHDVLHSIFIDKYGELNKKVKIESKFCFALDGTLIGDTFYVLDNYNSKCPNLFKRLEHLKNKLIPHTVVEGVKLEVQRPILASEFVHPNKVPFLFKFALSNKPEDDFEWKWWYDKYRMNIGVRMDYGDNDRYSTITYIYDDNYNERKIAAIGSTSPDAKDLVNIIKSSSDYNSELDLYDNSWNLQPIVVEFGLRNSYEFYPVKLLGKGSRVDDVDIFTSTVRAVEEKFSLSDIMDELNRVNKVRPFGRIILKKY